MACVKMVKIITETSFQKYRESSMEFGHIQGYLLDITVFDCIVEVTLTPPTGSAMVLTRFCGRYLVKRRKGGHIYIYSNVEENICL